MARPIVWNRWKKNPIFSIIENQDSFQKYFLELTTCIEDTPKQYTLFNLWTKNGYLETKKKLVPYVRISKVRGLKHESHRYAKTGIVNLKFFEDLATLNKVFFTPYEKAILKLIIFDKKERLLSRKGGKFLDKVRDLLLEIIIMRLSKVKSELEKWTTKDPYLIKTYIHSFDSISLEIQIKGIKELFKIKKDIEAGKRRIVPNPLSTPEDIAYHLIHIIPLTLVIKIFRIYLPFFVADEFLREKIQEVKFNLNSLVNKNNSIATFKSVKIIEKDKIKLREINLMKKTIKQYLEYQGLGK